MNVLISLFFFSSRRRHTRLVSDWSSDVCSSDLDAEQLVGVIGLLDLYGPDFFPGDLSPQERPEWAVRHFQTQEIGRASCREKVKFAVVEVYLRKVHLLVVQLEK